MIDQGLGWVGNGGLQVMCWVGTESGATGGLGEGGWGAVSVSVCV